MFTFWYVVILLVLFLSAILLGLKSCGLFCKALNKR